MKFFPQAARFINLAQLRRLIMVFVAGILLMTATACNQPNVGAGQPVPEATAADVDRARSNMSDDAINEDILAKQGESRARQTDGATMP
ncbi:MAG: hypothetical protein WBB01_14165 [Phormidesmis sp.]